MLMMKFLFLSQLYLAFLSKHAFAIPSLYTRQDADIQSVNLVFGSACKRTGEIVKAWDDAIKLVTNLKAVDFNEPAAIDFFGPPALNKQYQSKIQAVFDNAKTFGQGWKITPTPLKVRINIDCSPDSNADTNTKCKNRFGLKAFTWNTQYADGTGQNPYLDSRATMNMYLCNAFFAYLNLDDRINEYKNDPDVQKKYNMLYYTNRAYVILHEMMHANRVTYYANGNRPIWDMEMKIYKWVQNPDDRFYRRRLVSVDAYGPANTKILARTNRKDIASDITINADSYAQYVNAKYVQSVLKDYPWLPIVDGEAVEKPQKRIFQLIATNGSDWGLLSPNYENSLQVGDDLTFTHSDNVDAGNNGEDGTVVTLTDLQWTSDDLYPSEYIRELKGWVKRISGDSDGAPSGPSAQQIAIASYTNPLGDPSAWDRLISYDSKKLSILVANVLNGPDTSVEPSWASVIERAAASGKTVIGYVRTGYLGVSHQKFKTRLGSSDIADWASQIEQDIDKWYELYPRIGGIFFDEGWPECGPNDVYSKLYAHINAYAKRRHPGAYTVLNPGSTIAQCFEDTMDTLLTFESSYESYTSSSYIDNAWQPKDGDDRKIWHIVYKVPQDKIEEVAALARSRHVGYLEVTDDDNPNPYDNVPNDTYMRAQMNAVSGGEVRKDAAPALGGSYVTGTPSDAIVISSDYTSVTITWTAVSGALGYGIYQSGNLVLDMPASVTRATIGMLQPGTSGLSFDVRAVLSLGSGSGVSPRTLSASTRGLPSGGSIANVKFAKNGATVVYTAEVLVPYAFVRLFIGGPHEAIGASAGWPIAAGLNNETGGAVPIAQHKLVNYLVEGNDFYSGFFKYSGAYVEGGSGNADWSWSPLGTAPQSQSGYTYTWNVPLGGTDALPEDYVIQGQGYAPIQNVFGGSLRSYKCAGQPCDDNPDYDCKGSTLCSALEIPKWCDLAVNNLTRTDSLTYSTSPGGKNGGCMGDGIRGCGVFLQGTNCAMSGNDIWHHYQNLRKLGGCSKCGSFHADNGCLLTVNYVSNCNTYPPGDSNTATLPLPGT